MDISGILGNVGVALEARAYEALGAAVESTTRGALSGLGGRAPINQPINEFAERQPIPASDELYRFANTLSTTNYAQAFGSGIGGYDPKLKFLFKVSFEFDNDVAQAAERGKYGPNLQQDFQRELGFIVKQIDLPKFKFDYQEFNYYNFRTKMLKRVEHEALSFKMYDDINNRGLNFINTYLKLVAPVHRTPWSTGANLEDEGFNFNPGDMHSSAQRDVLGLSGNRKNILTKMKIEHFYLRRNNAGDGPDAAVAIRLNTFEFINPRLVSFDLPDLDYEDSNEAQQISCSFDYDALHMIVGQYAVDKAQELQETGLPGSDILSTALAGGSNGSRTPFPVTRSAGGAYDDRGVVGDLTDIAGRQLGRGIQEGVANALYRSGMGDIAGGALANTISTISGVLGTNASRSLQRLGRGVPPGLSISTPSVVSDSAIGGQIISQIISNEIPGEGGG